MHQLSNTINRKFIDCVDLQNLEIETDSGWHPVSKIMKTIPYQVWNIQTESNRTLECADDHILFDKNLNEIFVKDIKPFSYIQTEDGPELVTAVSISDRKENMFDITVDSDNHRYYTNGILSHNTTIANALSYAFYGLALSNIKKDNLINKSNQKNMVVSVEFEKDRIRYRIERGRRPTFLRLFIDDNAFASNDNDVQDESQGDSRETQAAIERTVGISHEMFKHIIALNAYTEPFLTMRSNEQRELIEQLLGITQLGSKAESLKEQTKLIKDQITAEEFRIKAVADSNARIEETIRSFELKSSAWNKKKIQDLDLMQSALDQLSTVDIAAELALHKDWAKYTATSSDRKQMVSLRASAESRLNQATSRCDQAIKQLDKLHDKNCPTCSQKIADDSHTKLVKEAERQLKILKKQQHDADSEYTSLSQQLVDIGNPVKPVDTFYEEEKEAYQHQSSLHSLTSQLAARIDEPNPYDEQILDLKNQALQDIEYTMLQDLTRLRDHQEFLLKLLTSKDSFIRKSIIEQNLNYLNQRLAHYLAQLGLPHTVKFINDLSVEITELGRDLDPGNLSRGENNRLILGLSFAFRDVWESLYQSINLMFIDELIDNGLDASGVDSALGILKKMSRDRSKSVFLISHRDDLSSRVNSVLKVIKLNGYTEYNMVN